MWTEATGRAALVERSLGRCEGCGGTGFLQLAHRTRRSQGGLFEPANCLRLCDRCHRLAHAHPLLAQGLGWELPPGADPTVHAAWIRSPYDPSQAGWHLLTYDDETTGPRSHIMIGVEPSWHAI